VALYTTVANAAAATASVQTQITLLILASSTAGTFNVTKITQGLGTGNPSAAVTSVACGSTCTGTAYVIYAGFKFSSNAASNLVTETGLYAPYIY
jgi:hypothetical protein